MVFLGFQLELKISTTEQLVLFDEILKICVSSLLLENSKDQAEVVSQDNKRERERERKISLTYSTEEGNMKTAFSQYKHKT
jgi:hypothetical protein